MGPHQNRYDHGQSWLNFIEKFVIMRIYVEAILQLVVPQNVHSIYGNDMLS